MVFVMEEHAWADSERRANSNLAYAHVGYEVFPVRWRKFSTNMN